MEREGGREGGREGRRGGKGGGENRSRRMLEMGGVLQDFGHISSYFDTLQNTILQN